MSNDIEKELSEILLNYRSLVADLVQDRHNRGISTEELKAVDDQALSHLTALLQKARLDEVMTILRADKGPVKTYHLLVNRMEALSDQVNKGDL